MQRSPADTQHTHPPHKDQLTRISRIIQCEKSSIEKHHHTSRCVCVAHIAVRDARESRVHVQRREYMEQIFCNKHAQLRGQNGENSNGRVVSTWITIRKRKQSHAYIKLAPHSHKR